MKGLFRVSGVLARHLSHLEAERRSWVRGVDKFRIITIDLKHKRTAKQAGQTADAHRHET